MTRQTSGSDSSKTTKEKGDKKGRKEDQEVAGGVKRSRSQRSLVDVERGNPYLD